MNFQEEGKEIKSQIKLEGDRHYYLHIWKLKLREAASGEYNALL